jgi:hypothetical protein
MFKNLKCRKHVCFLHRIIIYKFFRIYILAIFVTPVRFNTEFTH